MIYQEFLEIILNSFLFQISGMVFTFWARQKYTYFKRCYIMHSILLFPFCHWFSFFQSAGSVYLKLWLASKNSCNFNEKQVTNLLKIS